MSFTVRDIMNTDVITIREDATVREAAKLMSEKNVGCLVVMRDDEPVGIITERDILVRVVAEGKNPDAVRVAWVMSSPIVKGRPDMTLEEAARLMTSKGIKKLPIFEGGKLVGMITLTDLVRSQPYVVELLEDILATEPLPPRFQKLIRPRRPLRMRSTMR